MENKFNLLAFGTVPTVLVFVFHFIYWLLELFRQCWSEQFSILFIGFWNCSDMVGFYFPFYLLAFGTVPTVLVFVFQFIGFWKMEIGFWNCSDKPFYLLLELSIFHFNFWNCSTVLVFVFQSQLLHKMETVLVFVFHFIYWLLELFRQCWFLFSIYLLAFGTVPTNFPIYWLSELFHNFPINKMENKNQFTVGTVPKANK